VQRIDRFATRAIQRFAKNVGMRFLKADPRRVEDEVERVAQTNATEHVIEVASPIRDHAEHQPATAHRGQKRPNLVINAPIECRSERAIDRFGAIDIGWTNGTNTKQFAMIRDPKAIDRFLRKRCGYCLCGPRAKHRVRNCYAVCQLRMVDCDVQIPASLEEQRFLVRIHTKERVASIEEDSTHVPSLHTDAFAPGCGGPPITGARRMQRSDSMPEAYCVKCKAKKEIQNPTQVTMKNGRPAVQGSCPDCSTKLFKIGASS